MYRLETLPLTVQMPLGNSLVAKGSRPFWVWQASRIVHFEADAQSSASTLHLCPASYCEVVNKLLQDRNTVF